MALHRAHTLVELPNAFQDGPLEITDLENFYKDTIEIRTGIRGVSPIRNLFDACMDASVVADNSNKQKALLLMGHMGCGKSTELNNLAKLLLDNGCRVVTIYCDKELDRKDMAYTDILVLMAEALIKLANDLKIKLTEKELDVLLHFCSEVEKVDVTVREAVISPEGGLKAESPKVISGLLNFFFSLKASLKYNQETRVTIREKFKPRVSEWLKALDSIADQIAKKSNNRKPILIFEDLDKGNTWDVFHTHGEQLTGVHFPIIYTFPIGLSYSTDFAEMSSYFIEKRLPMIKVRNINGETNLDGVNVIKSIVESRCDLSLFEDGALDYLIDMTGGSLRDLFRAIREASLISKYRNAIQISREACRWALREIKNSKKIYIDASDHPFLLEIHNDHTQFSSREALLKMMKGGIVLEYNGDIWYNLHPLIEEHLMQIGKIPQKSEEQLT